MAHHRNPNINTEIIFWAAISKTMSPPSPCMLVGRSLLSNSRRPPRYLNNPRIPGRIQFRSGNPKSPPSLSESFIAQFSSFGSRRTFELFQFTAITSCEEAPFRVRITWEVLGASSPHFLMWELLLCFGGRPPTEESSSCEAFGGNLTNVCLGWFYETC